jgi:hypothetical protein
VIELKVTREEAEVMRAGLQALLVLNTMLERALGEGRECRRCGECISLDKCDNRTAADPACNNFKSAEEFIKAVFAYDCAEQPASEAKFCTSCVDEETDRLPESAERKGER